ncbi:unnamed protein product [Prorocentrum cordatum]|uniref:Uncharacterized protein n=1 Tax=Prorocentrum cordatum TaxID=2364126 RepID=A0ABN9SYI2_9DINO|nr:unnamed protein product [Polarella glacialis]
MHSRDTPLPRTRLLRNLLDFRDEARAVLSAEQSAQPKMATTALASLTSTIQEHLEYILLPTPAEMRCMSSECLDLPIVTGRPPDLDGPHGAALAARLAPLRGVGRGTRLAKLAELGAGMRCFKGAVMLWCDVVATMRRQWDDGLEPFTPAYPPPSPATRRAPARGVRAELFGAAACLAQQKLEICSREAWRAAARAPSCRRPRRCSW